MNTPIGPATASPNISFTPYDDTEKPVAMSTGGSYADMATPQVTPETPGNQAGRSPFSPEVKAGDSPFSVAGGDEDRATYTPAYSDFASPATNLEYSPASPSYSPADRAGAEDKDYAAMSPTYSPRSVAYTPSGSTLYDSGATASRPPKKQAVRGKRSTAATTVSAGRSTQGTSPAWSPTYSPSMGSGAGYYDPGTDTPLTSPMYTPMSTEYGAIPTSPVYTPTSPTQRAGGGGSSYRSSPYGAMTSPATEAAQARTDAGTAGASPEIQASTARGASPGYEDAVTSPSYTPQEAPSEGLPRQAEDVVYSAGISELDDEDAMSELFEPDDEEAS